MQGWRDRRPCVTIDAKTIRALMNMDFDIKR